MPRLLQCVCEYPDRCVRRHDAVLVASQLWCSNFHRTYGSTYRLKHWYHYGGKCVMNCAYKRWLSSVAPRASPLKMTRLYLIFEKLSDGLTAGTERQAHGSMLIVSAMLDHSGNFMKPRFIETCVNVMGLKNHASSWVCQWRGCCGFCVEFCP